jgi:hypothetical protein
MAAKLSKNASGARHLRWAREILATERAHLEHNHHMSAEQKAALASEVALLGGLVDTLNARVTPYRAFLEGAYVDLRARQRVADFLCDEAQREADGRLRPRRKDIDSALPGGYASILSKTPLSRVLRAGREKTVELARSAALKIKSLPASIQGTKDLAEALGNAAALLDSFNKEENHVLDPQREPLKVEVQKAVYELRDGLEKMDGRLRTHFSQDFIDSLYPELSRKGTVVAGEDDEEDDDTAPPDQGETPETPPSP